MTRARLERIPAIALVVLLVGLALHNLVMALLWEAGVRGGPLDVAASWKEAVFVTGLVAALVALGRRPGLLWPDRLALLYAALVLLYVLLPQDWLGGEATTRGQLLAFRHHLLPVAAYALGRLAPFPVAAWRRVGLALLAVAGMLALWGLVDVYLVPLDVWRESGVPGWFGEQLGLTYQCLSGLPENWIYNTGDETNPLRRVTSTFLGPLATAYALVVVCLLLAARRRLDAITLVVGGIAGVGLLFTHTRVALLALGFGLVVLALLQRRPPLFAAAAIWLVVSVGFVKAFPAIGPSTSYTASEIECLRDMAAEEGPTDGDGLSAGDASTRSHLRNLRDGIETVLRHPQGYGLGNAGVTASRTGVPVKAGESTFTEIGVDAGLAGALALIAWLGSLLVATARRSPWIASSVAALTAIGLQTDVVGVHWLAVCVFGLAGAVVSRPRSEAPPEDVV